MRAYRQWERNPSCWTTVCVCVCPVYVWRYRWNTGWNLYIKWNEVFLTFYIELTGHSALLLFHHIHLSLYKACLQKAQKCSCIGELEKVTTGNGWIPQQKKLQVLCNKRYLGCISERRRGTRICLQFLFLLTIQICYTWHCPNNYLGTWSTNFSPRFHSVKYSPWYLKYIFRVMSHQCRAPCRANVKHTNMSNHRGFEILCWLLDLIFVKFSHYHTRLIWLT